VEVVASLSQGRTAAAQCGLFTHKSVPVIFEPPCKRGEVKGNGELAIGEHRKRNCALYSIVAVQLRLKRGAGHVARMWQMRNAFTLLARKSVKFGLLERKAVDEKIILK